VSALLVDLVQRHRKEWRRSWADDPFSFDSMNRSKRRPPAHVSGDQAIKIVERIFLPTGWLESITRIMALISALNYSSRRKRPMARSYLTPWVSTYFFK